MATATDRVKREKTFGWRVLAALVIPLLLALARFRMRGVENIPARGAFVLAPNHYTNFDPLVTAYALWHNGRVPRFLAKASLFRVPIVGAILRGTGQIPVVRSGSATPAGDPLGEARHLVEDGLAVVVYPEGTLTREPDLWPMRGKFGAVRLALEHGIPVIPCAHWGAQQVLPRYSSRLSLFPRKTITLVFGEPVDLSAWVDAPRTPATYAEATEAVMVAITRLLEGLRGETAPLERWDPSAHGQSEIGRFEPGASA